MFNGEVFEVAGKSVRFVWYWYLCGIEAVID